MLKARFPIPKLMPNYPIMKQRRILVAYCTVHNFIRKQSRNDIIFHQYQANDLQVVDEESSEVNQEHIHLHEDNASEISDARDHIAGAMWMNYIQNH